MKISAAFLALCVAQTTAFTTIVKAPSIKAATSAVVLKDSSFGEDFEIFPNIQLETVQGGGTVRTYQMPPWAERCQYSMKTNGRPMKCTVQLWLGPGRNTHTLEMNSEDGLQTPYKATLKFKKMSQVLKISTSESMEMPVEFGVFVPPPERALELQANTERVWESVMNDQKQAIQGGSTSGGGGAVRYWTVPDDVESVQMVCWSKDTSKKSFRCQVEVLQGPNTKRQEFSLQCGGGSQPYHAVLQTPGDGWMVRATNKKFLEDGLFQMAVVPYYAGEASSPQNAPAGGLQRIKEWWE